MCTQQHNRNNFVLGARGEYELRGANRVGLNGDDGEELMEPSRVGARGAETVEYKRTMAELPLTPQRGGGRGSGVSANGTHSESYCWKLGSKCRRTGRYKGRCSCGVCGHQAHCCSQGGWSTVGGWTQSFALDSDGCLSQAEAHNEFVAAMTRMWGVPLFIRLQYSHIQQIFWYLRITVSLFLYSTYNSTDFFVSYRTVASY